MCTGDSSAGVTQPGPKADHSFPSSAEVKNAWNHATSPSSVFILWCMTMPRILLHGVVVKHKENSASYLLSILYRIFKLSIRFKCGKECFHSSNLCIPESTSRQRNTVCEF